MSAWRRFAASLRFAPECEARWIAPAGIFLGVVAAAVYWSAAQLWPASVAVVLSLFATTLMTGRLDELPSVFFPLIKYNALMALSAASSPLLLPENMTLGLIMISGHAASRALAVSVLGTVRPVSPQSLALALVMGMAPATLLGLPGLIGLAVAIGLRLLLNRIDRAESRSTTQRLFLTQHVTEMGFYLGALAAWKYV